MVISSCTGNSLWIVIVPGEVCSNSWGSWNVIFVVEYSFTVSGYIVISWCSGCGFCWLHPRTGRIVDEVKVTGLVKRHRWLWFRILLSADVFIWCGYRFNESVLWPSNKSFRVVHTRLNTKTVLYSLSMTGLAQTLP